jgi:hypothetical protein
MSIERLDLIDVDGALAEAHDGLTRAGLIVAAGAATAGLAAIAADDAQAAGIPASDQEVLNYALVLEYLQAAFYTEAERAKALIGRTANAAKVVGAVERAHVKAFRGLLGKKAVGRPHFDFQGVTESDDAFLKTAVAFEDLAVAAYKGQARRIRSASVLVSARHPHRRGAPRRVDALPQRQHAGGRRVRPAEEPARDRRDRGLDALRRRAAPEHKCPPAALHGVSRTGLIALGIATGTAAGAVVIAAADGAEPLRSLPPRALAAPAPEALAVRAAAARRRTGADAVGAGPPRRACPRAPRAPGAPGAGRRACRLHDAGGHGDRAAGHRPPDASRPPVAARRAAGAAERDERLGATSRARRVPGQPAPPRGRPAPTASDAAPVGVGRPGSPTPRGTFLVRNRLRRYRSRRYGPVAFGTSARSPTMTDWPGDGFIGIHGTDRPDLIPGRVSHGCVRLRNPDILSLARLMPVGTLVDIR